jgi:hypothetical protein
MCGRVWCGVVWCGVAWRGVAWCGVVWCGVVWCGVVVIEAVTRGVAWVAAQSSNVGRVGRGIFAKIAQNRQKAKRNRSKSKATTNVMV